VLKFYLSLKPYSLVAIQNEIDTAFCEGRIGFWISGSWLISRIKKDYPKLNFGITTIPKPNPQSKSISILGGEYLVINSATEHYAEAINFIKFMTSKEKSTELCNGLKMFIPPSKDFEYEKISWLEPEMAKVISAQIFNSSFPPQIDNWIQIKDIIEDELANIIEGKKTVEQGLKDAQDNVNKIMIKRKTK
ncbi:MAG: extracellular solute-binding protein, partial [Endomicrobia bacterium]|nr:extracellular solute-binding protein [Endomicrobiia bacterium]